jgi:PAS domain S-box-containing protein
VNDQPPIRYARTLARPPRMAALRIAIAYALFGAAWILFSDAAAEALFSREFIAHYHVQTLKGWAFIAVTTFMLYLLVRSTVTVVHRSERARREIEQHTRLLTERVRDYAIFTLDADGNVSSWNRGAKQITDWTEAEILGRPYSIFYRSDDISANKPQADLAAAAAEGWHEEEAPRCRQDGSEFLADSLLTALREDHGAVTGYLALIRDITERQRSADALRQTAATLVGMIDASPLAMVSLDRDANVIGWNPAAEQLFGFAADEVLGRTLPTVPEDKWNQLRTLVREQHAGHRAIAVDVTRRRKDGTLLELTLWSAPLYNAQGEIAGTMGIFVDLTDRNRAEQQIRQLNETLERRVHDRTARLEEANEELQAFSYAVSHDLRIPVRSLQALATDLVEKLGDGDGITVTEDSRAAATRIVGAAARMEAHIDDLLEYSRVSRSELALEPISLVLIVYEVLGRLDRDLKSRHAEVLVQEPLGWVMAHRLTLQQVILNLLMNAITFIAPGTHPAVQISSTEQNGRISLRIGDNGIGIDDADRERIFQLFERLPAAERYPGVGVGLAVVRRGVERMGGIVTVEHADGGGTVFCIDLPKAERMAATK